MADRLEPRIEDQISAWRAYVSRPEAIDGRDVDELEDHLRGQIDRLAASGLDADEAFLVAVKRLGGLDDLSREFAREHSDRLWKQLMIPGESRAPRTGGLVLAVGLAVGAALAIKIPALFGIRFGEDGDFYARFAALLVLPFLATYFLVRRRASVPTIAMVGVPFAIAAVVMAVYPFAPDGATLVLAATHVAVALWIVTGIAYVDGRVRSSRSRMDFIRFTGEWLVYLALIALGGGVLVALTMGVFSAIGLDAEWFVEEFMVPCGVAGAVVVAAWLVEAKQSVIENIAPVLTKLFTPLFTLLLLAFIVAGFLQGSLVDGGDTEAFAQRDLLILFDIVLVVVRGTAAVRVVGPRAARPAVVVRPIAAADGRGGAGRRHHGARGDDRPHRGMGSESQQARLARAQRDPVREPRRRRLAAAALHDAPRPVRAVGTMADGLPAGLPGVGVDRRRGVPAAVHVRVDDAGARAGRDGLQQHLVPAGEEGRQAVVRQGVLARASAHLVRPVRLLEKGASSPAQVVDVRRDDARSRRHGTRRLGRRERDHRHPEMHRLDQRQAERGPPERMQVHASPGKLGVQALWRAGSPSPTIAGSSSNASAQPAGVDAEHVERRLTR